MSRSKVIAKPLSKSNLKPARKAPARVLANRDVLVAAPFAAGGATVGQRVARANRWREGYNPLRGLTMPRAVAMIEDYSRGQFTDLMWSFGAPFMGIEVADPDLLALQSRRISAVGRLNWKIKTVDDDQADYDEALATAQAEALREAYNRIGNLRKAIRHLVKASFRGFAHLEKIVDAGGDIVELRLVNQWNVVRDGMEGDWKYNPEALSTTFNTLPADHLMEPEWFIVREVDLPINRFALTKFLRTNLCEKDWDAFVEYFGIPGGVVTGPPNVPADKEAEYQAAAEQIAKGGSGYLPNGCDYKANDSARGSQPFRPRLDYLTEKLVLAGTGGLLTMLAQSGSGTLAGSAHQEAFDSIAQQEGGEITEIFQEQIDRFVLEKLFPGQPQLAYFCIDSDYKDAGKVLDHAAKAKTAGFTMSEDEVSEETGYDLKAIPAPAAPVELSAFSDQPVTNRARSRALLNAAGAEPVNPKFAKAARRLAALGASKDLKPILDRIEAALALPDAEMIPALEKLRADKVKLLKAVNGNDALDRALEDIFGPMLAQGLTAPAPKPVSRQARQDAKKTTPKSSS